jgi:hypothetical protein
MAPTEEQKVARLEIRTEHLEENHREIRRTLEMILAEQRLMPRKIGGRVKKAIKDHADACKASKPAPTPELGGFLSLPPTLVQKILTGLVALGALIGGALHFAPGPDKENKLKPAQIQEVKP